MNKLFYLFFGLLATLAALLYHNSISQNETASGNPPPRSAYSIENDEETLSSLPATASTHSAGRKGPDTAPSADNSTPASPENSGVPTQYQNNSGTVLSAVSPFEQGNQRIQPALGNSGGTIEESYRIRLRAADIDTRRGPVGIPAELLFDTDTAMPDNIIPYLVQFRGPVAEDWKEEIQRQGGKVGDYIPNNAFIVQLTAEQADSVYALPFVQWVDYYHPAYKRSEDLDNTAILQLASRPATSRSTSPGSTAQSVVTDEHSSVAADTETQLLTVQTFSGGNLHTLHTLSESIQGAAVIQTSDTTKSRVVVEVPSQQLSRAVNRFIQSSTVEWVEPFVPPALYNSQMHWVVQGNQAGTMPLWAKDITGAGQIVGVGDTGLDSDMPFFWDQSQGLPTATLNLNQRKVISYHDLAGNGDWDGHDHGTHVAGTIAGQSLTVNTEYNGIAYDARLVFQDIGNGGSLTGIPGDLNTYFQQAYNDGARIHSNSWGSAVNGAYTSYAQDADEFMWNNKDFLIVFSAGNSGPGSSTVGSPGTAKNVLTSGASENSHSGYDPENVASFSSNGPTSDGRTKPTVTAPGHYLLSADNDNSVTTYNSAVRSMSGTSMSAPLHAGSAALVRQYFTDGFYPSGTAVDTDALLPSSALLKAIMVNSGSNMTGNNTDGPIPSTGQGWGRITLDDTLYFAGDPHTLFVDDAHTGLATGQSKEYTFFADGSQPVKVVLVWTDYYPALSSGIQLVNDLDLTVTATTAQYLGNVFANGESAAGGTPDRLNVVETVYLENPAQGAYTITISGHNVPQGPQPFALVITGLSAGSSSGVLSFDAPFYQPESTATLTLNDLDLNISADIDSATVHISSDSDPGGEYTLLEVSPDSGTFRTSQAVNTIVSIADGDTVTARYTDASNDEAATVTISASATIDATAPQLSGLVIVDIDHDSAVVSWSADEPVQGQVLYRPYTETSWQTIDVALASSHAVPLTGLSIGTVYEIQLALEDRAGNGITAGDEDSPYTFSTDIEELVLNDPVADSESLFQQPDPALETSENGLWHITDYKYHSATSAWYYGLEETKTYDTGSHTTGHLTTVQIDLSPLDNAQLVFNHILTTENYAPYDVAKVQVSLNGIDFTTLYQEVLSGENWEEIRIDLSQYVGNAVYLRFLFDSVDEQYNSYEGWLIDDIRITTFHKKRSDLDGNGLITLADVVTALQISSGMQPATTVLLQADVDGDGRLGLPEAIHAIRQIAN